MDPWGLWAWEAREKAGSCGDPREKNSVLIITVYFIKDELCTSLDIKYVLCPLLPSKAGSTHLHTADLIYNHSRDYLPVLDSQLPGFYEKTTQVGVIPTHVNFYTCQQFCTEVKTLFSKSLLAWNMSLMCLLGHSKVGNVPKIEGRQGLWKTQF